MGGKSSSSSKDPLGSQRSEAANQFMSMYDNWKGGSPQIPTFMQGAASTLDPMTKTLTESIQTGLPTNVTELGNAEREKALLSLNRDIFPQLLEQFGMGGQRFGSDAMNAMARTSGDVVRDLGINQLQQGVAASENAAGRRLLATQMAGLPIELQKQLMMIPELMGFVMGAMPTQKSSSWNIAGEAAPAIAGAAGGAAAASSEEFKENIIKVTKKEHYNHLDHITNMPIFTYNYKPEYQNSDDSGKQHIGIITEKAPDEIITMDKKKLYLPDAIGLIFSAIKALNEKVDNLNQQLETREKNNA